MDATMADAVANRKPVPEIDFTLHTMEDGSQVSTQERVCKGMFCVRNPFSWLNILTDCRRASTCDETPYRRRVLLWT